MHSEAEDQEGDGRRFEVRRMGVNPSGCYVAKQGKGVGKGDDVGEGDLENDES